MAECSCSLNRGTPTRRRKIYQKMIFVCGKVKIKDHNLFQTFSKNPAGKFYPGFTM
jgi:hypothetical protein